MSNEWPRRYTLAELEAIARSVGLERLGPLAVGRLQEAVEGYQWAAVADDWDGLGEGPRRSTKKRRREQLENTIKLCQEGAADEVDIALNELDGPTSQSLGAIDPSNLQDVKSTAERAHIVIKDTGPDRKRARRQFIRDLVCIFALVTGERPRRRVQVREYQDDEPLPEQEYGPTVNFVRAALEPFGDAKGCEADLKECLRDLRGSNPRTAARRREFDGGPA